MSTTLVIPKLGMTMQEGTLMSGLKPDGSPVHTGEPVFVLSTDKVETDVEAESDGVLQCAVSEGTTLPVGGVVGWVVSDGELAPEIREHADRRTATASPTAMPESRLASRSPGERPFVSPNARRLAKELSVDLDGLIGSGPNGRVVGSDVRSATPTRPIDINRPTRVAASQAAVMMAANLSVDLESVTPRDGETVTRQDVERHVASRLGNGTAPANTIRLSGMRGVIADRMHRSLQEMAQLTIGSEVHVDRLMALRSDLKDANGSERPVPTVTDLIIRAAALSLRAHPDLNATIGAGVLDLNDEIHIGVAVAVEGGLVVPVIRNADRLMLREIAERTRNLATAARGRQLLPDQLEGSTFCVTSLGSRGVDFFTPIINPPNVAILGVGRLRDTVRFGGKRKQTPKRSVALTLSLTFDHRALDGAPAADFLATVCDHLARPGQLL
jgi:pyruvate dehydrogenase E2 component (dihydrolipoamide acetyltransferase)